MMKYLKQRETVKRQNTRANLGSIYDPVLSGQFIRVDLRTTTEDTARKNQKVSLKTEKPMLQRKPV